MQRLNKKDIHDILALTPMQEGMLFHYLKEPENELYLEQLSLEISGEIDINLFEKAWDFVIRSNQMLRAVFRWDRVEKPVQIILGDYKLNPLYIDLSTSGTKAHQQLEQLQEIERNDRKEGFDLQEVPFRLILCKLQKDKYRMMISNHHILYDGWSTGIILKEFFKAYDDLFNGRELLEPVKSAFKEFVKWNRERGADLESEEKFWRNYLNGFEPRPGLPEKVKRRNRKKITSTGNYRVKVADDLKDKLERFVKKCNITTASLFYSVWGLLLQKINSSGDVIFDTTVSGRKAKIKGIEDIVGLFINTLPLRIKGQGHPGEKVTDFLSRTYRMLQLWSEFESSSLLRVNEYLEESFHNRERFFDSVVVIENYPLDSILMQKNSVLSVQSYSISGMTPYDMTVLITVFADITLDFTYNNRLFDRETTAKLAGDVLSILETIIENPQMKISGLLSLPGEVRDTDLEVWEEDYVEPYTAPRDLPEEKLAGIWAELYRLDKSEISIDTNFFHLGGHSLKAARLCAAIHKEFGVKVSLAEVFRFPTIRKLAGFITQTTGDRERHVPLIPVKPVETREYYPLAPAQQRLYMLQQLNPESTFYNGPSIMRLQGPVDKERIALAFTHLIRRHEILRTSFIQHNGEPVQQIRDNVEFDIEYYSAADNTAAVGDRNPKGHRNSLCHIEMISWNKNKNLKESSAEDDFVRPFDLSQAPLLRVGLIRTGNLEHLLVIDMHHIITDGTSSAVLTGDFASLYKGETLPALNIRYKDFSEWQNRRLLKGELKSHEDYWLKNLSGELPILNLATDFPRPVVQSFAGERISFELPGPLTRQMHTVMKETGTTLYMMLMSVYSILLSWYSGQEDILVGVPIAGRNHAHLENTVGLFLETLVIRNQPRGNKTFRHFLKEVKYTTLTANEHQDYPFSELLKQAATAKMNDLSRNPLFDVMLNVLNQDSTDLEIEGVNIIPCTYDAGVSKVDITLEAMEKEEMIELELEYCTALFKRETMERFVRHFLNALRGAVYNPEIRLGDMEIIADSEKRQIIGEFNDTTDKYAGGETVMNYFARQVKKTPDKIAVLAHGAGVGVQHVTYDELNKRADGLALLLAERGVRANTIVGIMVDRSPWLIIGLLGILKAGGAYLPLDPAYPEDRLAYMLKDSNTGILLKKSEIRISKFETNPNDQNSNDRNEAIPGIVLNFEHLDFEFAWSRRDFEFRASNLKIGKAEPSNLAYIIYTSGSTGRPKGVMVSHQNLAAYIHAFTSEFEIKETDVVLQQASYSFDVFVEEVFPCLVKGATLALPCEDEVRDTGLLSRFIARHGVNMIDCSPLMLNELNSREQNRPGDISPLHSIHTFISGGDVLKGEYIRNLLKTGSVYNTYGPTETTVCAAYHRLDQEEGNRSAIPIGKPISNYRVYILDGYHRLLPIGVPGEICISGAGVTMGYLNRPELTAEKFIEPQRAQRAQRENFINKSSVSSVSSVAKKLYKTGDLGIWLPGGSIEFLGRKDRQVNIRGFRIELGEIENRLLAHEDIDNAAVAAIGAGGNAICAYFISRTQKTVREMKDFLSKKLPDYMIPAYFVQMEEFPLGPGGKIDTKALPEPAGYRLETGARYTPPTNEVESKLQELWQELLGLERIGTADDFFDLGGDSILANRCIAAVREAFNVEIPLRRFFGSPYIKAMAEEIASQNRGQVPTSASISIGKAPKDADIPLSFPQERLWFLQVLDPENTAYFVPRVIRIDGKPDVELLERTFTEIIRRHEILRTVFVTRDDQPVQHILPPYDFKIPVIDWSKEKEARQSRQVSQWIEEEERRPFDFEKGPLLRVTLLKLKENRYLLVLTEHHLVHDGWTQGVLLKEFIAIFSAYLQGKNHDLPELPIQYADFAYWQRDYLQGEVLENHLDYWKKKLAGMASVLDLPFDRPRPALMSGQGALKDLHLSSSFTRQLKDFSRKNGATLFMTMLAVFKTLLYRYSDREDLCVGTGIANRKHKEIEGMLGMVINTLPLRTRTPGDISFADALKRVRETCLEAYQHQDTPFGKIVEAVEPERSLSYNPIFQVMFSFMDTPTEDLRLPGLELHLEPTHNRSSKFDINIVVVPQAPGAQEQQREDAAEEGETLVEWEYNTDVFDDATMDRMLNHYIRLLETVMNRPGEKISHLPLLEQAEIDRLLYEWNNTAAPYPKEKNLHELFAEQAERTPGRMAATGLEHRAESSAQIQISYKELNDKSDRLAYYLRSKGIGPDVIVGIMLQNSVEMIIGVLGILKAGGAYLPIDPDYPEERIQYMLQDSNAKILLKKSEIRSPKFETNSNDRNSNDRNEIIPGIVLDFEHLNFEFVSDFEIRASNLNSSNLCYIIYTSGSTGSPKGVMVGHRNVVRLVKKTNYVQFREGHRILQTAPLAFDASTFEIWGALLNGLTFFLTSREEILVPATLKEMICKYDIATMWMTSPLFNQVVRDDVEVFAGLSNLLVGGDVLSPSHIYRVKKRFPRLEIINGYGPTENTTFSTTFSIEKEYRENIPIGKPIANSVAYIVAKNRQLQPIGVPGELYVGGDGAARGYLNNPELTAERFINFLNHEGTKDTKKHEEESIDEKFCGGPGGGSFKKRHLRCGIKNVHGDDMSSETKEDVFALRMHPHAVGPGRRRLYKTGDLARWLPDGNIEFLGRMDFQVKIRGFRIEPGEIESFLMRHDKIKEAVVLVREENKKEKYLCAYIVSAGNDVPSPLELREYLSVSLPDYMIPSYFVLLEKIPLTANGKIDRKMLPKPGMNVEGEYEAPTDETEKLMAVLWSEVLGIEEKMIGLSANFFELGGHSLKATQLVSGVRKAFNVKLPLAEIFKHPTVRELSAWLKKAAEHKYVSIPPLELKDHYAVSSAQKRLYILQKKDEEGIGYNIPTIYRLEGCIDKERLEGTFKRLIMRHESLRTSFVKVGGNPVQVVHEDVEFEIRCFSVKQGAESAGIIRDFIRPFDLSHAPLMRVGLIQEGAAGDKYVLMVDMHHIITDGGSMGILIREFMKLYSFTDADEELPPLSIQYKDFSQWRNSEQQETLIKQQEAYWLEEFAGEIPALDLIQDYPTGRQEDFAGCVLNFSLGEEETGDLKRLAKEEDVTIYMVLLAIYNVLLARLSNQGEIIVGTPTAGRGHADLQPLIGMFVNTLALRNYPGENKRFRDFLKEIKERTLAAFENQDYPFEDLAEKVAVDRDAHRNPLFDVMFTMQNLGLPELEIPGVRLKPYGYETPVSKFDLTLTGIETGDHIDFRFEYRTSLFKEETISDFANYYKGIIAAVLENREIKLSQIDLAGFLEVNVDERIAREINGEFEF